MHRPKDILYYSTLALLVYMPFHIFLSQWLSTATGGLDAWKIGKDVFTAAVFALSIGLVLLTKTYTKKYLWLLGLSVVYTLLHILLYKTTDQPLETGVLATVYNSRLFWYLLIGYGLSLVCPKRINLRDIIKIFLAVSTAVCLIAMIQWVLPKDVLTHFGYSVDRGVKPAFFIDDKENLPRVFSTIRDPNSLGAFLILPVTILSYALVRFWRSNKRQLIAGLLMLHALVLFLTFSRSALAGALVSVAVMFALMNRQWLKKNLSKYKYCLLATVVLVGAFAFVMRDQYVVQNVILHSDENTTAKLDSNEKHFLLAKQGVEGTLDEPLGNGPGTAGLVSIQNKGFLTENYYIQIGYEVGVLGLAIFLALLYLVVKSLWQIRNYYLASALLASFIGLSLINMLLHIWSNEAVAASWFLLAGVVLAVSNKNRSKPA
jgi:hypothetical protein